ncbi:MAG: EAL domain-containing protein [Burkholderiales bacterium]|nr:EAL domain-containing protein [Burkholderiales bacterium]
MKLLRRLMAFVYRRPVQLVLSVLTTLVVGGLLVFTIQFTLFDPRWLTFLGGILFAAILSLASQASKSEWVVSRITQQLERMTEQLEQEKKRSRSIEESLQSAHSRAQMIHDLQPTPLLYIDRDLRIRQHNRAFLKLTDWPAERIDGQLLRDVAPREYLALLPRFHETLAGSMVSYNMAWSAADGSTANYLVKQVPWPPDSPQIAGFYILMLPEQPAIAAAPAAATAELPHTETANPSMPHSAITGNSGETLYLHSLTDRLAGAEDPRAKLLRALEKDDEFLLFAQKILPLRNHPFEHGCHEILLRLREEEDNLLPPGGFIPVAEQFGLTEDIDRWVVRKVISWSMAQQKADPGWTVPLFCVNLSDAALSNPEFARFVRTELHRTKFAANRLCFEVGELETISNHDNVARFIAALKPAGCRFTADAFGSVKLSFSHLSGLALDFVKIDGVIIQNMFKTPGDLTKLRAIVGVCQKLGMRTIAEFVEDDRTLEKLRELGIDYAQGFGIARPGPIDNIR